MKKIIALFLFGLLSSGVAVAATNGEFGNHCTLGLTMGKQVVTDCSINWVDPVSKKTFCFSSEQAKTDFAKDTTGNVAKAQKNYTEILASKAATGAASGAMKKIQ